MKCPRCHGTGKITEWVVTDTLSEYEFPCRKCNGTGVIEPLTNEQWFCGLSTEEKAKWLSKQGKFIYDCVRKGCTPKIMYEEDWEYWLKEKHE